jgi:hypothetical protein
MNSDDVRFGEEPGGGSSLVVVLAANALVEGGFALIEFPSCRSFRCSSS